MTTIKMSDLRNGDKVKFVATDDVRQNLGVFKVSKILPLNKEASHYSFVGETATVVFLNSGVTKDSEFELVTLAFKPFVGMSNCKDGIIQVVGLVCQALKAVGQDDNANLMLIQLALDNGGYPSTVNKIKNFINYF